MLPSNRSTAIQAARRYSQSRPVFLDTETTGLDDSAEIVEITLIDHQGMILVDTLVKPRRRIPLAASRIHGITDQHVANSPTWPEVWPEVERNLLNNTVGVYNADFDARMLFQSNQQYRLPWNPQQVKFFCIMKLYSQFLGVYRWQTLENAGRQCGINLPNSHRSCDDTLLARALLLHMASFVE